VEADLMQQMKPELPRKYTGYQEMIDCFITLLTE
jgi:hypothetical protein